MVNGKRLANALRLFGRAVGERSFAGCRDQARDVAETDAPVEESFDGDLVLSLIHI